MSLRRLALAVAALLLAGCATLREGVNAPLAKMAQWGGYQNVYALLEASDTPPAVRATIETALGVCTFAERDFGLACGDNYVNYVDIGRAAERWQLLVAPDAVAVTRTGCSLAGDCAGFATFTSRAAAEAAAQDYLQRGLDVDIKPLAAVARPGGGAPLLNTIAAWPAPDVAYRILHDVALQSMARADDDTFALAFADVFARAGTRRWLARTAPARLAAYDDLEARRAALLADAARWQAALSEALSSGTSPAGRRARKQAVLDLAREVLQSTPADVLGGRFELDRLRTVALNNAHVAGIATGTEWTPRFEQRLRGFAGEPAELLRFAAEVARLPKSERLAALATGSLAAR